MFFRMVSDGKHSCFELDGKTYGENVKSVSFDHNTFGDGEVTLSVVFDLKSAYDRANKHRSPTVADEDVNFDDVMESYKKQYEKTIMEYPEVKKEREELKALLDGKSNTQ